MTDEPYHAHLPEHLVEETTRRRERAMRQSATRETARFWQRMLGDKEGRKQFWAVLEDTDAFNIPFKFSPDGALDRDGTLIALAKAREGFARYRTLFVAAPEQIMLMHKECDPDFQKEPIAQPNAQGDE